MKYLIEQKMNKVIGIFLLIVCIALAIEVKVHTVETGMNTGRRLSAMPPKRFLTKDFDSGYTIRLGSEKFQKILGFGGAFTEAAALTFSRLRQSLQEEVLNAYWGDGGIVYTIGRVHMNSCDFSVENYAFANVSGDYELKYFDDFVTHDTKTMIPLIFKANRTSGIPLKIFITPWSPPAWMKTNGQMDGSYSPGLKSECRTSWALYYSKFIAAYKSHGIDIWGLTVQNEPEFAAPWEACVYTAEEERDFIKLFLGPRIKADYPKLKMMIYDHNRDNVVKWATTILSDSSAAKYVDGTGVHWYEGNQFWNIQTTHLNFPDKFILGTEACNCPLSLDNWGYGENYAHDVIGDLNSWAVGWTDWNLLLDIQGGPNHLKNFCTAPIIADIGNQKLLFQPAYWYFGQITKFIHEGSERLDFTYSRNPAYPNQQYKVEDGTNVGVRNCNGSPYQQWSFKAGSIKMKDFEQCLDVKNMNKNNGADIQTWSCAGSDNQKFSLENGEILGYENKCLDLQDSNTESGANVQMWDCSGNSNQKWIFDERDGSIKNSLSGKCLESFSYFGELETTVFENIRESTHVIVVLNRNDFAIDFKIEDRGHYLNTTIPERSIQTYYYMNHLEN